ncbi:hypothetical protein MA16_Dca001046 [Dendrobium catenatum]|uniref:Uncharacterized protein n=1 Tax=Dendrobium catenatum TaxID=906689 RepID=A0A2I0WLA9_9ASPA|nr:hypothetical protein MA16_Dca001046 [Dendrobium catenatum]
MQKMHLSNPTLIIRINTPSLIISYPNIADLLPVSNAHIHQATAAQSSTTAKHKN